MNATMSGLAGAQETGNAIAPQNAIALQTIANGEDVQLAMRLFQLSKTLSKLAPADFRGGILAILAFAIVERNVEAFPVEDQDAWRREAASLLECVLSCYSALSSASSTHQILLEAYERVLDTADYRLCGYREEASFGSPVRELAQAAMDQIERIASSVGLWINWFDHGEKAKPANHWRKVTVAAVVH
jgi:hypothetical protein